MARISATSSRFDSRLRNRGNAHSRAWPPFARRSFKYSVSKTCEGYSATADVENKAVRSRRHLHSYCLSDVTPVDQRWRIVATAYGRVFSVAPAGTSRVTTLPAPTSASSSMEETDRPCSDPNVAPDTGPDARIRDPRLVGWGHADGRPRGSARPARSECGRRS